MIHGTEMQCSWTHIWISVSEVIWFGSLGVVFVSLAVAARRTSVKPEVKCSVMVDVLVRSRF